MKIYFGENGNLFYHAKVYEHRDQGKWCSYFVDLEGFMAIEDNREELYESLAYFAYETIEDYAKKNRAFLPISLPIPDRECELWGFEFDSASTDLFLRLVDGGAEWHNWWVRDRDLPVLTVNQINFFLRDYGKKIDGFGKLSHNQAWRVMKESGIPISEWSSHRACRHYFGTKNISYGRDVI